MAKPQFRLANSYGIHSADLLFDCGVLMVKINIKLIEGRQLEKHANGRYEVSEATRLTLDQIQALRPDVPNTSQCTDRPTACKLDGCLCLRYGIYIHIYYVPRADATA